MSRRIIPVRPGLLVSMRTSIKGGVSYRREDLVDEIEGEGTRTEWKTEKKVENADEYTRARRLRARVVTLIGGACVKTAFTYICPLENEALLDERIAEAQAACDAFNEEAVHSQVTFDLMRGRYMEDTKETVQAVRREIHELLEELNSALKAGEVQSIRDVAARATQMGRLLEEGTEARSALERAVKESRRVAGQLVKRIKEGADAVAEVLAGANVSLIATARHTFDEDETGEIVDDAPGMPAVALEQFEDLGQDYVEPPAPEPAAEEPSPGLAVGADLAASLAAALTAFGEYSFDDKGPHEVMDMADVMTRVRGLEPRDMLVAFGVLEEIHGGRGVVLAEAITEELPQETMEAMDVLSSEGGPTEGEPATAAGIVVPLMNAASLLGGPAAAAPGADGSQTDDFGAALVAEATAGQPAAESFEEDDLGEI